MGVASIPVKPELQPEVPNITVFPEQVTTEERKGARMEFLILEEHYERTAPTPESGASSLIN